LVAWLLLRICIQNWCNACTSVVMITKLNEIIFFCLVQEWLLRQIDVMPMWGISFISTKERLKLPTGRWDFSLRLVVKNLISKFEEKSSQKLTKKQLKNKWDNMKKEYTWFMEFKNCANELGWDEAKWTVECSKEWWDKNLTVRIILPLFIIHFACFYMVWLANFFI
jgi:hypothetical protein